MNKYNSKLFFLVYFTFILSVFNCISGKFNKIVRDYNKPNVNISQTITIESKDSHKVKKYRRKRSKRRFNNRDNNIGFYGYLPVSPFAGFMFNIPLRSNYKNSDRYYNSPIIAPFFVFN
jgi:hypothetical protein